MGCVCLGTSTNKIFCAGTYEDVLPNQVIDLASSVMLALTDNMLDPTSFYTVEKWSQEPL